MARQDIAEIVLSLEEAAARSPKDAAIQMELGKAYLSGGDATRSEAAFRRAGRLMRNSPQPGLGVAATLLARGRPREAITQLRNVLHSFPSSADAWLNLGNLLRARREFGESARCYRKVLTVRPDDEAACLNLSICLLLSEQFGEAESELRAFIRTHGATPDLLCNLGQALRYAKRYPEAEQVLRSALEADPSHSGARYNLALTLSQCGQTGLAERALRELLENDPRHAEARAHLGELLLGTERFAEGWREYRWRDVHIERSSGDWEKYDPAREIGSAALLRGRHVRLKGEQGLGDVLFFLRFASALTEIAASVTLDLDPRLAELIGDRPPFHWSVPAGSESVGVLAGNLPSILGASTVAPPFRLRADASLANELLARLLTLGPAPYVGVTWEAGTRMRDSSKPGRELHKRIDPETLARVLRA
ncbi:MAG: tetratricopeptide repeat protein, partial [Betaproteobacteria bacterium]|nr:tetratricopeptide repeat protein [Betaproteobacteria bacterium]